MKPNFWSSALAAILSLAPAAARLTVALPKPMDGTAILTGKGGYAIPVTFDGAKVTVQTVGAGPRQYWVLTVTDNGNGNAARVKVPPAADTIRLAPADFNRISVVRLALTDAKGAPPDVAAVVLTDGKGETQTATLSPEDSGKWTFRMVGSGDGKVTVSQGAATNKQTLTVQLPLKRATRQLELPLAVTLPQGMSTLSAALADRMAGAASKQPDAPAPVYRPGPLSGLLGFVIALVAVGGIGFLLVRTLRARGVTAESALSAVGVQLPDTPEEIPTVAAPPPPPPDPTICPFCGARKDPNGPCEACAVGAATPVAVSAAGGPPRLVVTGGPRAGAVLPLSGTMTVGRDPSRDIAVPDDASMSRHHATIEVGPAGASVRDNGSSNGTFVNGRKVASQVLRPGDEVAMGASRFRYEG